MYYNLNSFPATEELCATVTNVTRLASKVDINTMSNQVNGCAVRRPVTV